MGGGGDCSCRRFLFQKLMDDILMSTKSYRMSTSGGPVHILLTDKRYPAIFPVRSTSNTCMHASRCSTHGSSLHACQAQPGSEIVCVCVCVFGESRSYIGLNDR